MKRLLTFAGIAIALSAIAGQLWISPDGRHLPTLPLALPMGTGVLYPAPEDAFVAAGWRLESPAEAASREADEEAARKAAPKTISKLDLLIVLREINKRDLFAAWLETSGLLLEWNAAQTLATNHPLYEQALSSVQEALGISDEQRDEILERIAK